MATFYFPGLDKRLLKIVWSSTPLGLLYIWVRAPWYLVPDVFNPTDDYVEPAQDQNPLPGAYHPTITDLPGYDTIDLFAVNRIRGEKVTSGNAPDVVDPVTAEMLAHYAAWTPPNADPYYKSEQKIFPGSEIWIVDRANWQLVYNHVITGRAYFGTRDEALNHFKTDGTVQDPSKVGVVIEQIFYQGMFQSPPNPPSQDGWAFWNAASAQAGWQGHMETGPTTVVSGQVTSMALILNLTQIARSMTTAQKNAKQFKFRINWPSNNGYDFMDSVAFLVKNKYDGQPADYEPLRSFPVKSPQLQPQFSGDGAGTIGLDPFFSENGSTIIGGGAYTEVTVKTSPFDVTMNFFGEYGSGNEG